MASMKRSARVLWTAAVLLIFVPVLYAQDDAEPTHPIVVGDFDLSGSATGGYRFETVKGYVPQFQEMFDLGKGFRLFNFNLDGITVGEKKTLSGLFFPPPKSVG